MVNPTPAEDLTAQSEKAAIADAEADPTPLRCFVGAIISAAIAFGLYYLTISIHTKFASTPVPTSNITAINISIAVRTLVTGLSALGMVTFGIATMGLTGLGIQLLFQGKKDE